MNTVLYIENNYCQSLKQLQAYFKKDLKQGSSLFEELLTLQRDGLIAKWLSEGGAEEQTIAKQLNNLSSSLNTSDLMKDVAKIVVNQDMTYDVSILTYLGIDNIQIGCEGKFEPTTEGRAIVKKTWWKKDIVIRYQFKVKNIDKETFVIKANVSNDLLCEIKLPLDNQQIGGIIDIDVPIPFTKLKCINKNYRESTKSIVLSSNDEIISKLDFEIKYDFNLLSYVDFVEVQLGDRGNFKVISSYSDIYERVDANYVLRCIFKIRDTDLKSFTVKCNYSDKVNEIILGEKKVGDKIKLDFPIPQSRIMKNGICAITITSDDKTITSLTLVGKERKKFSFIDDVKRFIYPYIGSAKDRSIIDSNKIPQKMLDDLDNMYFLKIDRKELAHCNKVKYLVAAIWEKYLKTIR